MIVLGDARLDAEQLRRHVAGRLPADSLLRRRLGEADGAPAWVPAEDFAIDRHVGSWADGGAARDVAASIFAEPLDRAHPLWRIDVAETDDAGTVIVWRLHHALADGTAAMRFASSVLWDEAAAAAPPAERRPPAHTEDVRRRSHLSTFIERELTVPLHRSPFDHDIGSERALAFASLPMAPLHDAARRLADATLNDAVLTVVGGGLRAWLVTQGLHPHSIRIKVPVSLHREGDALSNRDSFFSVPVSLDLSDPVVALRHNHEATQARKQAHDAEQLEALSSTLSAHSRHLQRALRGLTTSPRLYAVCVSNVPGPRGALSVAGRPVRSVHSVAEIGLRHGLRIAVVSASGWLHLGFCADPNAVPDLDVMVDGVVRTADDLITAA